MGLLLHTHTHTRVDSLTCTCARDASVQVYTGLFTSFLRRTEYEPLVRPRPF